MADNEDIGAKLDRIASLLGSFAPTGSGITSGQSSSINQFMTQAESALGGAPATLDQTVKKMQDLVKMLNASGIPLSALHKQMNQLTGDTEVTRKIMSEFSSGLRELGRTTPRDISRHVEQAMKVSLPNLGQLLFKGFEVTAVIGAVKSLYEAFAKFDTVAATANRAIATVAIQGGSVQASGLGGVFGQVGSDAFKALGSTVRSTMADLRLLNLTFDQSSALMSQAAKTLPSYMAGAAPAFAGAAGSVATRYGLDPAETLNVMTSMFRRGATSAEAISRTFSNLEKLTGPQGLGLSVQELFSGFNELWTATRQYGVTTESVTDTLVEFKTGLREQVIAISEIGKYQAGVKELRPEQIVALASLSRGVPGAERLFGASTNPMERANEFLKRLQTGLNVSGGIDTGAFAGIANATIEKQAAGMGLPLLLARDIARARLFPQLGPGTPGRQEYERFLYSATGQRFLGGPVPGREPGAGGTPLTAGSAAALGTAFGRERAEALKITDATITIGQRVTMYADFVTLETTAALQGDTANALRAGMEAAKMQKEALNEAARSPAGLALRSAGYDSAKDIGRTMMLGGPISVTVQGLEGLGAVVESKIKEHVHRILSGTRNHGGG